MLGKQDFQLFFLCRRKGVVRSLQVTSSFLEHVSPGADLLHLGEIIDEVD